MLKRNKVTLLTGIMALTMASTSYAAGEFSIGGDIGFFSASATGGTAADGTNISGLGFGGELGYKLDPNWEVGAEYITGGKTVTVSGLNLTSRISRIMANFVYHFDGDLNPLYVGVKAGVGMLNASTAVLGTSVSATTSAFSFGATAGYDYMIGTSGLSVGPKADIVIMTFSGASVTNFDGLLTVKYHL
jgi:hypothetical protein